MLDKSSSFPQILDMVGRSLGKATVVADWAFLNTECMFHKRAGNKRDIGIEEEEVERKMPMLEYQRHRCCSIVAVDNPLTRDLSWFPCPSRGFLAQRARECLPTGDCCWTCSLSIKQSHRTKMWHMLDTPLNYMKHGGLGCCWRI